MNYDFKINFYALFPSFVILNYFLIEAEVDILGGNLNNTFYHDPLIRQGFINLYMTRTVVVGVVITLSSYIIQREVAYLVIEQANLQNQQVSFRNTLELVPAAVIVYRIKKKE